MARQGARRFDVVVVGAGSAGCAAAAHLVDAGLDVCLIEAGPDYGPYEAGCWPADILDASVDAIESHDWGFPGGAASSRAKIVGGCSAHNGCGIVWPARDDIDTWESAGLAGWTFAALEPHLARAERALRSRPSRVDDLEPWRRAFLAACVEHGFEHVDLNDPAVGEGVGLVPVNAVGAVRWNAAFAYLDPIRRHGSFTLLDGLLVDRIRIEQGRATAVVARAAEGEVLVEAERVVLAAGAYGSPAILLRSGIGDEGALAGLGIRPAVDLPAVGANLRDHPTVDVPFPPSPGLTLAHAAAEGPAAQCLLEARSSRAVGAAWDLVLGPWTAPAAGSGAISHAGILVTVSLPESRGSVRLRSADPTVLPAIDHGFLTDSEGHDVAVAREGVELALALASTEAARPLLSDIHPAGLPDDLDGWLRGTIFGNYHPCCTCAMGSVVDEAGRVHGVEALHVVDASVLPVIPRANIHLTVVAVAARLAEALVG